MEKKITSTKNTKVQLWRSLLKRSNRIKEGCYLIEGFKMVEEALHNNIPIKEILFKESTFSTGFFDDAQYPFPTYVLADHVFDTIASAKTPQGILAVLPLMEHSTLSDLGNFVLVLDEVQDPGNTGTLIRTADAAGFTGVLLSNTSADLYSPKTLRATMGSIFHLPMVITSSLPHSLTVLKQDLGYALIAGQLGAPSFFSRSLLSPPLALIIGNEGRGISKETLETATDYYSLPMKGCAESLNAAMAGGIMMYDLIRFEGKESGLSSV
ncbi:MAG: RNA methyltransferase [Clostridiales bacterium]|nr:RNA methyltransferase [Clostridiales bacterium]